MSRHLFTAAVSLTRLFARESARQAANDIGYILDGRRHQAERQHEAAKGALDALGRGRVPNLKQVAAPRGAKRF
jgi:hypothetical protein